jgi:predicted alpha/beta superfamily hydrolase
MTDDPNSPHTLTGRFRFHAAFPSRYLRTAHDVIVYLPPGYDAQRECRYPVLYLQDGQNLFDAATSFSGEWHLDEIAESLIMSGVIEPLIIVGIYNAGAYRIDEYTPTRDSARRAGGRALQYGRMLMDELKPFIDGEYRTRPGSADTGLGGSSLGGLVSLYLGLLNPGVYGRLAILSPSVWWDNRFIVRRIRSLARKPADRIWLSVGTAEGDGVVDAARRVRGALVRKGWTEGTDLAYAEIEGAPHNEAAWAAASNDMLKFLFPAGQRGDRLPNR